MREAMRRKTGARRWRRLLACSGPKAAAEAW